MAVNPITPELRVCERPIVSHPVLPYFQDAERGVERIARFWAKVAKVGPNDCWEWTASRGRSHGGYGQFKVHMGPVRTNLHANRIAYALATGHDPIGLVVRHTCDNPSCCNPAHLLSGTVLDNARDKMERGRWRTGNQAGTANPRAKLTDLDIRIIVEKLQAGHSNQRIASMLPVGHALVSRIRYGLSWATEAAAHGWTPSPRPRSTTQGQAS